jgi:hypothetical protein
MEHLRRLRGKIALADDIAVAIEGGLAGDEDDPTGGYLNNLRITRRRAELGRIDAGDRRICGVCHWASSPEIVMPGLDPGIHQSS